MWALANDELALGDAAAAFTAFERVGELSVETGDEVGVAVSELGMANAAWAQGEHARARGLANDALARYRGLGAAADVAMVENWLREH